MDLDLISHISRRLREQLIEVCKTWMDLLLSVQKGSSIIALKTEKETIEQNLL